MSALIARQYWEEGVDITGNLRAALLFLMAVVRYQADRSVALMPRPSRPVLVYTDASDEAGRVRVGALVIDAAGTGHVVVYDVPDDLRSEWGGETVINQGELYAAPLTVCSVPDLLRGQDVLWFIDNTSAESALVKAGSPTETMCELALGATAALASLGVRPWFEHVPSPDPTLSAAPAWPIRQSG